MLKRVPHFDTWVDPKKITAIKLIRQGKPDQTWMLFLVWDDGSQEGNSSILHLDHAIADDIARNVAEWIEQETRDLAPPEPPVEDESTRLAGENLSLVEEWWEMNFLGYKHTQVFHEQARAVSLAARGMKWEGPE
jgi:hypothetical protein